MNKLIVSIFIIILLLLFGFLLIYANWEKISMLQPSARFPFFELSQQELVVEDRKIIIIDNSDQIDIKINDKKKLEQLMRKYSTIFTPDYSSLRITFTDELQDFTFSWETGTPFSHSVDLFNLPYVDISININLEVLKNHNWDKEMIERELAGILVTALERASMNVTPETDTTRSESEEQAKSDLIEKNTQTVLEQLNNDNPNLLFELTYE